MIWLLKIKAYLIALGSFLLALIGTYLWAKHSGKSEGSEDQVAADNKANAEAVQKQNDTRAAVEAKVNDLPKPKITVPAPLAPDAQTVGTADPSTAAGKLQDWLRQD